MKRIIAPFALSLLAVSTLATAGYTEAEAAQMAMDKIKSETKIDILDDYNNARREREHNFKRNESLKSDKLSPWTPVYYRDFKIKSIAFNTMEDCITAKEYAVKQLDGILIQPSSDSIILNNFTTIGYKLVDNIETRITCNKRYINQSAYSQRPKFIFIYIFELNYNTAYKLSDAELEADRLANTRSNELQADRVKKQMADFLNQ